MKPITKVSHSPLPWKVVPGSDDYKAIDGPETKGLWIADYVDSHNAAFICRAVNSHFDLLFALKEAREVVVFANKKLHTNKLFETNRRSSNDILRLMDQAIAQSESHGVTDGRCNWCGHEELLTCLIRIRGEVSLPSDIYKWVDDLIGDGDAKAEGE